MLKKISLGFTLKALNILFQFLSIYLITNELSETQMGFYYLILNILGLQVISELGFTKTLAIYLSHESGKIVLEKGLLKGPEKNIEKIKIIFNYTFNWFKKSFLYLYLIYLIIGVFYFVYVENNYEIFFLWILLSFLSSLSIFSSLLTHFFEGINHINKSNIFLSIQLIFSNVLFISTLKAFELYSLLFKSIGHLIVFIIYLVYYKTLIKQVMGIQKKINSLKVKFHMQQKKFALTSIFGFFIYGLYVPLSFNFISPEFSGKLGFSIQIVNTGISFLMIIFTVNYPLISQKISDYDINSARLFFLKITNAIFLLYIFGTSIFFLLKKHIYVLFNNRFLDEVSLILLFSAGLFIILNQLISSFSRLFKEELFLKSSIISAFFSLLLLTISIYFLETIIIIFSFFLTSLFIISYNFLIFKKQLDG